MTAASLEPVYMKVGRAREHLEALERSVNDLMRSDAEDINAAGGVDGHFDGKEGVFVVKTRVPDTPPTELSLPLGDCLQNLRSALDHLVWQLTLANNRTPNRATAFPIFREEPADRNKLLDPMRKIHPDAQAIIEEIQPFKNGEGDAADTFLWVLHELNNVDKHRLLHPTEVWIVTNACQLLLPDGTKVEPTEFLDRGAIRQGTVIASYKWPPWTGKGEMDVTIDTSFDVAFAEPPKIGPDIVNCAGAPLSFLMREFHAMVRDEIIPEFVRFF